MTMDRMLVVVFDNETKAYEGRKALLQLDSEGSITVYAYAVLAKHADGTATVKQEDDSGRHSHGSDRRFGFPACSVGCETHHPRRERRCHEGRPRANEGRTREGPRGPQGEAAGKDQPARLQDSSAVAKGQR